MTSSNGFYAGYKNRDQPDTDFIVNLYTGILYSIDDEQNVKTAGYFNGTVNDRTEIINAIIADDETPDNILPLFAGNNPVGNIIDYDPLTETGIWEL